MLSIIFMFFCNTFREWGIFNGVLNLFFSKQISFLSPTWFVLNNYSLDLNMTMLWRYTFCIYSFIVSVFHPSKYSILCESSNTAELKCVFLHIREGSNLEEVVEKQADLIEYLKQHNTLLSKRLLNLTAQH